MLVAWDGSATAARALGDAMPFLERAQRVDLVIVTNAAQDVETARDRITRYLDRHDVRSTFHPLTSAGDVASTLLSHAFESGADHPRGCTRHFDFTWRMKRGLLRLGQGET